MNKPTYRQVVDVDMMIERTGPRHMVQTVSMEDFVAVLRCAAWYRDRLVAAEKRISELELEYGVE